jgi:hypothetical protein
MPTETQKTRLRADLGLAVDADVDDLFEEAEETHTAGTALAYKLARLIGIDRLLISAAREVDYVQNESQEKASQRFAQLKQLRALWAADYTAATAAAASTMQIASLNRKPKRMLEYPDA